LQRPRNGLLPPGRAGVVVLILEECSFAEQTSAEGPGRRSPRTSRPRPVGSSAAGTLHTMLGKRVYGPAEWSGAHAGLACGCHASYPAMMCILPAAHHQQRYLVEDRPDPLWPLEPVRSGDLGRSRGDGQAMEPTARGLGEWVWGLSSRGGRLAGDGTGQDALVSCSDCRPTTLIFLSRRATRLAPSRASHARPLGQTSMPRPAAWPGKASRPSS